MNQLFNNVALWTFFSTIFRSFSSFLFWVVLPLVISSTDLDRIAYVYAICFSTIAFIEFGGVSNVLVTKISNRKRVENESSILSLISTLFIQIIMCLLVATILFFSDISRVELLTIYIPIFIYFVLWNTIKKYIESLTSSITIYIIDVLISILHICLFLILSNQLKIYSFIILYVSLFFVIVYLRKSLKEFFVSQFKYLGKYLFYLIKKSSPLLISSILVIIVISFERNILNDDEKELPYQYILTILLQLSQLIIIPFQGLHNKIWSFETNNMNKKGSKNIFLHFIISSLVLIGPISIIILNLLVPIIYEIKIDILYLNLTCLFALISLMVQLLTVKTGSTGRFKSLGWFSLGSSIINMGLLFGISILSDFNLGVFDYNMVSIILFKYIVLSCIQVLTLLLILSKDLNFNFNLSEIIVFILFVLMILFFLNYGINEITLISSAMYYFLAIKVFGNTFKKYLSNV